MGINLDKPHLWKQDIADSVDLYNTWFMNFAPRAFMENRRLAVVRAKKALIDTNYLHDVSSAMLKSHPEVLPILRMCTCPPIARDRLIGLAKVSRSLIQDMEDPTTPHLPVKMSDSERTRNLHNISLVIAKMTDHDIFTWLDGKRPPSDAEIERSVTIVADRLCGAIADPIIRNSQEKRQLESISDFLSKKGYSMVKDRVSCDQIKPGTFAFHVNVPAYVSDRSGPMVNISVDAAIMPLTSAAGSLPLLIEAKSAGDFTNVNKRRKEEAIKMQQLRNTYGSGISYVLFLCGYFDTGYLGYEAAEGIDWIWEHRISDLELLGI